MMALRAGDLGSPLNNYGGLFARPPFLCTGLTAAGPLVRHGIHYNIHPEFCIVLRKKSLVAKVIVPFAAIVLIAVQYADTVLHDDSLQIVMHQVVPPSIQLKGRIGRPFFK